NRRQRRGQVGRGRLQILPDRRELLLRSTDAATVAGYRRQRGGDLGQCGLRVGLAGQRGAVDRECRGVGLRDGERELIVRGIGGAYLEGRRRAREQRDAIELAAVRDLVDGAQHALILTVDCRQLRTVERSVGRLGGKLLRGLEQCADVGERAISSLQVRRR